MKEGTKMYTYVVEIKACVEIEDPLSISELTELLATGVFENASVAALTAEWFEGDLDDNYGISLDQCSPKSV